MAPRTVWRLIKRRIDQPVYSTAEGFQRTRLRWQDKAPAQPEFQRDRTRRRLSYLLHRDVGIRKVNTKLLEN